MPSEIYTQKLLPVDEETLNKYYSQWKKRSELNPERTFQRYLGSGFRLDPTYADVLAKCFGISLEDIIQKSKKPLAFLSLLSSDLPDPLLDNARRQIEKRVQNALLLVLLDEIEMKDSINQLELIPSHILSLFEGEELHITRKKRRIVVTWENLQY